MAILNPPLWLQASSYNAVKMRELIDALFAVDGVIGIGALKVTQAGTPAMRVNVSAGKAVIPGTTASGQGSYMINNDATVAITIAAANVTNPRIDLIVARVYDAETAGSSNMATIEAITGNPASTPVAPSVPANSLVLAQISVAANATTVISSNITDKRVVASMGTPLTCTSTTKPVNPYAGMMIFETDTRVVRVWSGTVWYALSDEWVKFTPVWYADNPGGTRAAINFGNGARVGRYRYDPIGKTLKFHAFAQTGTSGWGGGGSGPIRMILPNGFVAGSTLPEQQFNAKLWVPYNGTNWAGVGFIFPGYQHITPMFPISSTNSSLDAFRNVAQGGGAGSGVPLIPNYYPLDSPGSDIIVWGEIEVA